MTQRTTDATHANGTGAPKAAGTPRRGRTPKPYRVPEDRLLANWGLVARQMGRAPTVRAFDERGGYCAHVLIDRYGRWTQVPTAFRRWAAGRPEWSDVAAMLTPQRTAPTRIAGEFQESGHRMGRSNDVRYHRPLPGRVQYGQPLHLCTLRHEPDSEAAVVVLFAMLAAEMGYHIEKVRSGFPDCEALRRVSERGWQRVLIEFEYESRNFDKHGHDATGCDVLVCWRHNWPECPAHLEVIDLHSVLAQRRA